MEWTYMIGIMAGICTTIAVLPQIIKAWNSKKVEGVSPVMFAILTTGICLWLLYGILKKDLPLIATNGISLALNGFMLLLMIRFRNKRN